MATQMSPSLTMSNIVALRGEHDYDDLLSWIGDRTVVMLGEASHGTHEFYRERSRITKRLIEEKGFVAVAVEADWPDAYRVNRYVTGNSGDQDAEAALGDFRRFPSWMWRNEDVASFISWMRLHNDGCRNPNTKARFYGLDLYSLRTSMEAVVNYLNVHDPEAAQRARERYACFDLVGGEGQDMDTPSTWGGTRRARTRSLPSSWTCGASPWRLSRETVWTR